MNYDLEENMHFVYREAKGFHKPKLKRNIMKNDDNMVTESVKIYEKLIYYFKNLLNAETVAGNEQYVGVKDLPNIWNNEKGNNDARAGRQ